MRTAILTVAVCAILLWVSTAEAATDEEKCLAGRAKAKGKYEQCVAKWLSQVYGGEPLDTVAQAKIVKCRIKYADAWTRLQGLTGSTTCVLARFVNNGATVTDNLTGLIWEKKTTVVGSGTNFGGDASDVDNYYDWTDGDGDTTDEDGAVFTDFLMNLNAGGGLASANGWRLPTFAELQTIVLPEAYPCTTNPCIDAAFGSTQAGFYWSATVGSSDSSAAREVDFYDGGADGNGKNSNSYVRAVRGGL